MNVTVYTDHAKGTISVKADGAEAAMLNINALGWGEAEAFTVLIAATLRRSNGAVVSTNHNGEVIEDLADAR